MATFVPTANVSFEYTFVQFSGTTSAFQTALDAAFPEPSIQVFADGVVSGNALVIVDNSHVISVAPNSYLGYNQGNWAVYAAAKMNGDANSVFTPYPPA